MRAHNADPFWRSCTTCGVGGTVSKPGDTYARACPTCMSPVAPDDPRCCAEVIYDKRCVLRAGHWAYCGQAVNGHYFGDAFARDLVAMYRSTGGRDRPRRVR